MLSVQSDTFLMIKFVSVVLMLSAKFAAMCVATSSSLGIDNFRFAKQNLLAMIFYCVSSGWNTIA